ncbi:MAG TPA: Crp/Fnr family transcriptional regulator [Eudoraea sp.]|nr:Crp/Fnr family transcriptional regulator [Eudoraea sp.]
MENTSTSDKRLLFTYIDRYVTLTTEEELFLKERLRSRRYLKGQYVLQQGDICHYESFVLSGCLKVFYSDSSGGEHVVMFAVEEWWVSDMGSFVNHTPADYNIQCLENCELLQFTHSTLEELYTKIPALERFFRIIIQNAFVAAQKRIVNNHRLTARDRYISFIDQYPDIAQRVPQYLIASYLGITKEFLSKIRAQINQG